MVDIKRMPGRERLDEIPNDDFLPEQRASVAIWGMIFLVAAVALAIFGWVAMTAAYATLIWVGVLSLLIVGLIALGASFINHPT